MKRIMRALALMLVLLIGIGVVSAQSESTQANKDQVWNAVNAFNTGDVSAFAGCIPKSF